MQKLLLILVLLATAGCSDIGIDVTGPLNLGGRIKETPTINLPVVLRQRNWLSPQLQGSCTHATLVSASRVVSDAEDSLIEGFIRAARIHAETVQRRQLITATWRLSLDQFPCGLIYLPLPPLQSVTSITYVDAAGTTQTLADYQVDTYREPGRIVPAYGSLWPTARCQPNSVNVIFDAGYGDLPSDVPESTRQAIKLLAGHYFENREAVVVGTITTVLPMAVDALLSDGKWGSYA